MIRHVLTWKLAADDAEGKNAAFAELSAGFGPLPHLIPEIKMLQLGRDIDETDGNWDVALIIDFATTADLEVYQQHPEHQKVKDIVRRVTSARTAIDFEL
jgi:hypothetical protein